MKSTKDINLESNTMNKWNYFKIWSCANKIPKKDNESKIDKWDYTTQNVFYHQNGQQNQKITHGMGENIFKLFMQQEVYPIMCKELEKLTMKRVI